jgi:formylglycine-generating enzyme required for sulfatase activity
VALLFSCNFLGTLNDPADPNSPNYQGYTVVREVNEVVPMPPKGVLAFPPTLYSAKLLGGIGYNFQISSDLSFTSIECDKIQDTNIFIPTAWEPSKGIGTYYFRVRARKDTNWGLFSTGFSFNISSVPTTTSTTTTITTTSTTTTTIYNGSIEMVDITGGSFQMGSNSASDEQPIHSVTVSSFSMSKYEVTQSLYKSIIGTNPSAFSGYSDSENCPVESVTWYDAIEFCNKLSQEDGLEQVYSINSRTPASGNRITFAEVTMDPKKNGYRLPTEAEWEYAARGGSTGTYFWGENSDSTTVGRYAWFSENSNNRTHAVGQRSANAYGLYDIIGNVWEWCWDWYSSSYQNGEVTDPVGTSTGESKIGRGGFWGYSAAYMRTADRYYGGPSGWFNFAGFRVVRRNTIPVVSSPVISPTEGTYTNAKIVSISAFPSDSNIRYTLDGSTPTETNGTVYSGAFLVSSTKTIKAIAYKQGWTTSRVSNATYTITGIVAAPTFSPASGTYTTSQSVSLSCALEGSSIRYTLNGTNPSSTNGILYSDAISVPSSVTIKAIAYKTEWEDSPITTAAYNIVERAETPVFSPTAGVYDGQLSITIASVTPGVTIRYTLDGTTPSESKGLFYTDSFKIESSKVIKAIAYKPGVVTSVVAEVEYFINEYDVGDTGPSGGLVFYNKGNYSDNWRYLEAAAFDQSTGVEWNRGNWIYTGATATGIGTGENNTDIIISNHGASSIYAGSICSNLVIGIFDDWFLPSMDELNLLYENLHLNNLGSFYGAWYWSSSESTIQAWQAKVQYFVNGNQDYNNKDWIGCRVRAIRAF